MSGVEELAKQTNDTLISLWQEMGVEDAEREEILERLQDSVRGVYAKFVEDEEGRKSSIENKTKEFKDTIHQLAQSLLISDETPERESSTLIKHMGEVEARCKVLQGIFDERQRTLSQLQAELHGLWGELDAEHDTSLESIGDKLTTTRMQQFRSAIAASKQEKEQRIAEVEQLREAAAALWEDLDWEAGTPAVPKETSTVSQLSTSSSSPSSSSSDAAVEGAPAAAPITTQPEAEGESQGEIKGESQPEAALPAMEEEGKAKEEGEEQEETKSEGEADEEEAADAEESKDSEPAAASGAGAGSTEELESAPAQSEEAAGVEQAAAETEAEAGAGASTASAATSTAAISKEAIAAVATAAAESTEAVGVSPSSIAALHALVTGLEDEKQEREGVIKGLGESITALWGKLRTPAEDQHAFLESHEGVGDSTLAAVRGYLRGLEADFSAKVVELTGKCRERIGELFVKMRVEGGDREDLLPEAAIPLLEGQITEEIYEKHIAFEKTIEARHAVLAPAISLWDKRQQLLQEREEYLQIISDPKRLLSRGGGAARLREEKLEKRIKKLLPNVCKQLRKAAEEAEKTNGFEVRLGGCRVIDALDEFEASQAKGAQKKKQEKEQAKARRKRETMAGGAEGAGGAAAGGAARRGRASVKPRPSARASVAGGTSGTSASSSLARAGRGRARSRSTSSARQRKTGGGGSGAGAGAQGNKKGPVKAALRATQLGNKQGPATGGHGSTTAAAGASKAAVPPVAKRSGGPGAAGTKAKVQGAKKRSGASSGTASSDASHSVAGKGVSKKAAAGAAAGTPAGAATDVHVTDEARKSAAKIVSSLEV